MSIAAAANVIRIPAGMHSFPLPVATQEITVSLLWHPRMEADPANQWLRGLVLDTCGSLR